MKKILVGIGLVSVLAVVLVGCNGSSGDPKITPTPVATVSPSAAPTASVAPTPSKAPSPSVAPTPSTEPSPSPSPIQAEAYTEVTRKADGTKAINTKNVTPIGASSPITVISGINTGEWARYDQVDFGTGTGPITFEARVAAGLPPVEDAKRTVELRLDSLTNPALGSFSFHKTSDTTEWLTYEIKSFILKEKVTGVHDVYLVFSAADGVQSVMDMDWFQLSR